MIGLCFLLISPIRTLCLFTQLSILWNFRLILVLMAAMGISFVKSQRNLLGFLSALKSAACEWILISFLLIHAVISYLLTKYASYCELQLPCIFCSRLDHVLGKEKPEFYRNLFCKDHRSEISFLISCHNHGKLADARGMCEECVLSFNNKPRSNTDMHKFLTAQTGSDHSACNFKGSVFNGRCVSGSNVTKLCSCCNKSWISRQHGNRVIQLKSPRSGMTKPNIPLPRSLNHRENMKKMRGRFAGPVISNHVAKSGYDPSHVAYTELKITSDSENEFPFSDDDDHNSVADEMEPKEGLKIQDVYELPTRSRANSVATKNLTNMSSNARVPRDDKHLECGSYSRQDLVDGNQQQGNVKTHPIPKLISLDDFYLSFNMMEASVGVSTEKSEVKFAVGQNSDSAALSEFISLLDVPSPFTVVGGPFEASHKKSADSTGSSIMRQTPINKHEGNVKSIITIGATSTKSNQVSKELLPINAPSVDLSGGLKSSIVNKERDVFDCVAENINKKDAGDTAEELKPFPRENCATQGTDLYLSCPLSGKQGNVNEFQIIDASDSDGVVTKKSISTEIGESSGFESLDVNEVEGENIVDQLKHQVEYDKECISALSLELEEERNASAIAANQAMAMINRLQEEKAALHMEALQYLRMMEEQAEYDVDALEKANDLVAEKEKEIQDLEAELEYFRLKYPGESALEVTFEEIMELRQKVNTKGNANVTSSSMFSEKPSSVGTSLPCFEEERKYIAHCLEDLERKLHQFARDRGLPDSSGSDDSSETRDGEHDVGASMNEEPSEMDDQVNDQPASSLTLPAHEKRDKDHKINQHKKKLLHQYDEVDWMSLRSELSDLNERVESLETDYNFLEHTFNSLEAGKEGVQFVKEISRQLLELRKKIFD